MFGLIVSGRPVITEAQTVSTTQLAFQIPSSPPFHHLVVFLLPGTVLTADQAAAVYIQLTPNTEFKLLGAIANDKQSAIFRVRGEAASAANGPVFGDVDEDAMVDDGAEPAAAGAKITVGISLEPAAQVAQALAAQKAARATPTTGLELVKAPGRILGAGNGNRVPTKMLAKRIIENAYEYMASFATGIGGREMVPLKSFQDWWKKFEGRIDKDPSFLEKAEVP